MLSQVSVYEPIPEGCIECQFEDSRLHPFSDEVSFRLAMSATDAGNSTGASSVSVVQAQVQRLSWGQHYPLSLLPQGLGRHY